MIPLAAMIPLTAMIPLAAMIPPAAPTTNVRLQCWSACVCVRVHVPAICLHMSVCAWPALCFQLSCSMGYGISVIVVMGTTLSTSTHHTLDIMLSLPTATVENGETVCLLTHPLACVDWPTADLLLPYS